MKKSLLLLLVLVLLTALLVACTPAENDVPDNNNNGGDVAAVTPAVMTLKGPSGVGMAKMIDDAGNYAYSVVSTPDEIVAAISNGDADIAAMPTNLAAKLYAKTDGDLQMLAIINYGSLYILEAGESINSLADLAGKTIYATGQGSNPQYILEYLLAEAGLTVGEDVEIVWKSEHAELATLMASGEVDIAMLPEPNVSVVLGKNDQVRVALDLNDDWAASTGGKLTMTCVAARKDFIAANPEAIAAFLTDLEASINYAIDNVSETAALCATHGIIDNEAIAAVAIPKMSLTFAKSGAIEQEVSGYLQVLFDADPSSVGGAMPGEDIYYSE